MPASISSTFVTPMTVLSLQIRESKKSCAVPKWSSRHSHWLHLIGYSVDNVQIGTGSLLKCQRLGNQLSWLKAALQYFAPERIMLLFKVRSSDKLVTAAIIPIGY